MFVLFIVTYNHTQVLLSSDFCLFLYIFVYYIYFFVYLIYYFLCFQLIPTNSLSYIHKQTFQLKYPIVIFSS